MAKHKGLLLMQPIHHVGFTWDSPPEDMEYEIIYLNNFVYGMDSVLVFYFYELELSNGYFSTSDRRSCDF